MKLNEEEKKIFEDFLSFLQLHPELKKWELSSEPVLSLPDLEIDPSQRLVRCNQKEVGLTAKEYSLLCLLTVNNGRVLTYSQIYEKVWGEALTINERGTIGYHVRNLRKKLYSADPHHPFIIESVREVGYRFQTTSYIFTARRLNGCAFLFLKVRLFGRIFQISHLVVCV